MLKGYEKFRFQDKSKKNDIFFEINWVDDEDISKCKVIKITLGDKTAYIDRKYLQTFIFMISKEKEQAKMVPQTTRRTRFYNTTIGIKAKKDIKKGEEIVFPLRLTLPTFEEEVVGELKNKLAKKGQIIKPGAKIKI